MTHFLIYLALKSCKIVRPIAFNFTALIPKIHKLFDMHFSSVIRISNTKEYIEWYQRYVLLNVKELTYIKRIRLLSF